MNRRGFLRVLKGMTDRFYHVFLDILFPRRCPLCGELRPPGSSLDEGLCSLCHTGLLPLTGPFCTICGAPLISELNICLHCREGESGETVTIKRFPSCGRVVSLFPYRGPARELMYQYKFRGRKYLAPYLARRIWEEYGHFLKDMSIVPAPSEPRNLKKRGWNPVLVLARELSKLSGGRVEPVLGRKRSISQKGLNRKERQENLKGKIYLRRPLRSRSVVFLDDIWTTGATAHICDSILREAGLEEILVLTVCRD